MDAVIRAISRIIQNAEGKMDSEVTRLKWTFGRRGLPHVAACFHAFWAWIHQVRAAISKCVHPPIEFEFTTCLSIEIRKTIADARLSYGIERAHLVRRVVIGMLCIPRNDWNLTLVQVLRDKCDEALQMTDDVRALFLDVDCFVRELE